MKASLNDPAVVEEICARLIGGEGITQICKDAHMPCEMTVYNHMAKDADFCRLIARAREQQQEAETEKMIALADEATPETWQVKKLQIWARQWRAAKLAPKKYGDKLSQEHSGPDGGPIRTEQAQSAAVQSLLARLQDISEKQLAEAKSK